MTEFELARIACHNEDCIPLEFFLKWMIFFEKFKTVLDFTLPCIGDLFANLVHKIDVLSLLVNIGFFSSLHGQI